MHSRLISWSRILFLAGIVLALALVIPAAWFPFQLAKVAVFSLLVLVSIVLFTIGGGARELRRAHGLYLALIAAALPLSYVLSWAFSPDKQASLTGVGLEVDTVLFVVIGLVSFWFAFVQFRTLRMVRLLSSVVFWTLSAVAVFQIVAIMFGMPFEVFTDRSVNLIGKWNDFGVVLGLLAILLLVQLEMSTATMLRRALQIAGTAVVILLLALVNFSLVWWALLACALIIGVAKFLTRRGRGQHVPDGAPAPSFARTLPWFAGTFATLSVLFLVFGSSINTGLTKVFPVSSLEVRPAYTSTIEVLQAARGDSFARAFVGTGPNTFERDWVMHKPQEVNQSLFWNLDFNVGFSTFVTALGTVGLIGVLAWLIPLALVLIAVFRVVRLGILSREEKIAATSIVLSTIFLWAVVILYVPSANVILLAFVLSGAAFGYLWRQGQASQDTEEEKISPLHHMLAMAALVVLVVLAAVSTFVGSRRLVAEAFTQNGLYMLNQQQLDAALARGMEAQKIEKSKTNMRLITDAGNLKLQQLASATSTPTTKMQEEFGAMVNQVVNAGRDGIALYPNDYRQYISLARVYDFLASLKIQGAYESAQEAYKKAITLNPTNPEISLALSRLEAAQGNTQLAEEHLVQALTLKQNYTDAILFVVQLSVAKKDIPNAIRAATAATQTAPGVAPIWFELGLLHYAAGNTKEAITPLEKAISIVPEYANAKYFLGLSYYTEKRTEDAIKQFEDLLESNPTSQEVNLILANMKAGKPAFESAQPPVTSTPERRATAPLPQ